MVGHTVVHPTSRWRMAVAATVLVCTCACTSAMEHFEAGQQLETAGDIEGATGRYIAALERDATLTEARARLEPLVPRVMTLWRDRAESDRIGGRPVDAAEWLRQIDEFITDTVNVGRRPEPGPDYFSLRREVFDEAIELLLRDGDAERDQGRFRNALAAFEQVERYDPDPERRQQAIEGRAQTRLDWARRELSAGRFRAAFDQADLVIDELGEPVAPWAELVDAVQAEALDAGTVRLAVAPVTADPEVAQSLSDTTVGAINDELVLGPWRAPPLFVALLDQGVVASYLRRGGYDPNQLTLRDARRIGRQVGADVLVLAEISELRVTERRPDVQTRPAQTRAGEAVTYRFIRGRLNVELAIEFSAVDIARVRTSGPFRVTADADDWFERAEYDGDRAELRLSSAEQRLFNGDNVRQVQRRLEDGLAARLAERLGRQVFRRVLDDVP